METIYESAARAVRPWDSIYGEAKKRMNYQNIPQQDIDFCLSCPLGEGSCDKCDGHGNMPRSWKRSEDINLNTLRRLMKLKRCNQSMCEIFGVSMNTLLKAKRRLKEETK